MSGAQLQDRAEMYRRLAAECLNRAERATNDVTRRFFVEMAAIWHKLAERAEQRDAAEKKGIPE